MDDDIDTVGALDTLDLMEAAAHDLGSLFPVDHPTAADQIDTLLRAIADARRWVKG